MKNKWEQKLNLTITKYENMLKNINLSFTTLLKTNQQLQNELEIVKNDKKDGGSETVEVVKQAFMKQQMEHDRLQETFQEQVDRFTLEREELCTRLDRSARRIHQLERDIRSQEDINHSHDIAVKNFNDQESQYKSENITLRIRVEEISSKLSEAERVVRQKDESLFELSKELESTKNSLNNCEHSESQYKREMMSLTQDKNTLEKQLKDFQMGVAELDASKRQLGDRMMVLQRENEILQHSLNTSKKNDARLLDEMNRIRNQFEISENRNKDLELDILRIEQKSKYLVNENKRLKILLQESGDESEETRMIRNKELELSDMKQRHKIRKISKERNLEAFDDEIYDIRRYPTSDQKVFISRETKASAHDNNIQSSIENNSYRYNPVSQPNGDSLDTLNPPTAGLGLNPAKRNQIIGDDPFWKNRDHEQKEMNILKVSDQDDLLQNTPKRGRNRQKKMDPAEMAPAGRKSLERFKPVPFTS